MDKMNFSQSTVAPFLLLQNIWKMRSLNVLDEIFGNATTRVYMVCVEDMLQVFNLIVSNETETTTKMYNKYWTFSRIVNGYITMVLMAIGVVGNTVLLCQVAEKRYNLSKRLRAHLAALCFWDTLLVLSCFLSYGVLSVAHGIIPFHGSAAYLLLIFQPLGSFAVSGTVLQVAAISVERYIAVSRPLHDRELKARCAVKWIVLFIALLSALLNLAPTYFERRMMPCLLASKCVQGEDGLVFCEKSAMNVGTVLNYDVYYNLLCRFIPDVLFRFPLPVIIIIALTIQTLVKMFTCGNDINSVPLTSRENGGLQHQRKNTYSRPLLMLTVSTLLLNLKFLVCHSLYMVHTAIDMMNVPFLAGELDAASDTTQALHDYVDSLYLNDVANCLAVFHSATNWVLFIKFDTPWRHSNTTQRMENGEPFNSSRQVKLRELKSKYRSSERIHNVKQPVEQQELMGMPPDESAMRPRRAISFNCHMPDQSSSAITNALITAQNRAAAGAQAGNGTPAPVARIFPK